MSKPIVTALIGANTSMIVAVTALLLNYRGLVSLDARMLRLEQRMDTLRADLDKHLPAPVEEATP